MVKTHSSYTILSNFCFKVKIGSKGQFYKNKMKSIFQLSNWNEDRIHHNCHSKIQNFNMQKLLENNYQKKTTFSFHFESGDGRPRKGRWMYIKVTWELLCRCKKHVKVATRLFNRRRTNVTPCLLLEIKALCEILNLQGGREGKHIPFLSLTPSPHFWTAGYWAPLGSGDPHHWGLFIWWLILLRRVLPLAIIL